MSEIKTSEVLEILDKLEMFQGQRAGRELWADKPIEVQEEDLKNFNRDIGTIRKYIESQSKVMERILTRLEEERKKSLHLWDGNSRYKGYSKAIKIIEEECGISE